VTQNRSTSLTRRKPFAAAGRLFADALGYLLTHVLPALGLWLSLGLLAAAGAAVLFSELAEDVHEGDTRRFDESALAHVNRYASPALTSFMRAVTYLGSNEFLAVAGAGVVLAFVLTRRRRGAVTLLVSMGGAALLNFSLKLLSGRERPEPFFGATPPDSYSFPSGHALLSLCFHGMIAALVNARLKGAGRRALVWAGAAFLVALIGLSRVYLGVHYPSDVAAGYVAAFVWVVIVASAERMLEARSRRKSDGLRRTGR